MAIAYILFLLEVVLCYLFNYLFYLEQKQGLPDDELIEEGPFSDDKVVVDYYGKRMMMTVDDKMRFDEWPRFRKRQYTNWATKKADKVDPNGQTQEGEG